MEKHYVGESNTDIRVDCGRDVTSATVRKVYIKKPDGTQVVKDAGVYRKQYLRFMSDASLFDRAGEYEMQAYVEMDGWSGYGQTARIVIYERYA